MNEGFEVSVNYDNQNVEARLWAEICEDRGMGIETTWLVEITLEDGETLEILSINEYPQGSFEEIERDSKLNTPLDTFTRIIINDN